MKQQSARPQDHLVERWARALGVSEERLLTLIQEVVTERQRDLIGAAAGFGKHHPSRLER
jgi:hypothetical protein